MSREHLRERAYQYLSEQIIAGTLPAGSQVSELSLAKAIGISRTPVREAIRRLVHEGLLEQKPRFGTLVRSPDRQDIVEVFEEREALEGYAAGLAAERIDAADLARLERLCAEMARQAEGLAAGDTLTADALQRFLTADMGFHLLLLRAAGNRRIMKIVAESRMLSRVFGTPRQEHNRTVVTETCQHHGRILRALKRRDADAARTCIIEHIRASKDRALTHYDRTQARRSDAIPLGLSPALLTELDRIEQGLDAAPPAKKSTRHRA